jgi:L-cystine uptake protein TcyP (sodium:dicarboxylate symporter family)
MLFAITRLPKSALIPPSLSTDGGHQLARINASPSLIPQKAASWISVVVAQYAVGMRLHIIYLPLIGISVLKTSSAIFPI